MYLLCECIVQKYSHLKAYSLAFGKFLCIPLMKLKILNNNSPNVRFKICPSAPCLFWFGWLVLFFSAPLPLDLDIFPLVVLVEQAAVA